MSIKSDSDIILGSACATRVMKFLLNHGPTHLRGISNGIGLYPHQIKAQITRFEAIDLIIKVHVGNKTIYSLNRKHSAYKIIIALLKLSEPLN